MALELPHWLTEPLAWIGLTWPEADEEKLFQAGQAWITFSTQLQPITAHANSAATHVWTANEGSTTDAFKKWWTDDDGPAHRLDDDAIAALVIGAALILFAAITLAMKILFIAQLILLAIQVAAAIAAAFVSFGASTATIPAFIAAARLTCTRLLRKFVDDIIKKNITGLLSRARALLKKVAERRLGREMARDAENRLAQEMARDADRRIMDRVAESAQKVNPLHNPRHPEYGANCIHCVQAYELRRRGLDVSASGLPKRLWPFGGRPPTDLTQPWGRNFTSGSQSDIESAFRAYGPGARGVVYIDWNGNGAHVFNVENVGGRIHFVDAQNNTLDASHYFSSGGPTAYLRLDDLAVPNGISHFTNLKP